MFTKVLVEPAERHSAFRCDEAIPFVRREDAVEWREIGDHGALERQVAPVAGAQAHGRERSTRGASRCQRRSQVIFGRDGEDLSRPSEIMPGDVERSLCHTSIARRNPRPVKAFLVA
jgi:hypothetical protein